MIGLDTIVDCYKLLSLYYELNPIICGSSALFIQNKLDRCPNDVDVVFMMSKSDFLDYVRLHKIVKPKFNCKVDWHFNEYEFTDDFIEIVINRVKLKVQPWESVVYYMKDFVLNKYNSKWIKHLNDLIGLGIA